MNYIGDDEGHSLDSLNEQNEDEDMNKMMIWIGVLEIFLDIMRK